jgi:hypothetical protein
MQPWPAGEFDRFCQRYRREIPAGWNDRFWLVPSGPWGSPVILPDGSAQLVAAVKCRLRIELVADNPHVHGEVAYLAPLSDFRRSNTPFRDQHHGALCDGNLREGAPLKMDSRDLDPKEPIRQQIPAMHEMGHYLGLDHVNGRGNDPINYGANKTQQSSLMGYGVDLWPDHAWPWKHRLMMHIDSAENLWRAVMQRPGPQLLPPPPAPAPRPAPTPPPPLAPDPHGYQSGVPSPDGGVAALRFRRAGSIA